MESRGLSNSVDLVPIPTDGAFTAAGGRWGPAAD